MPRQEKKPCACRPEFIWGDFPGVRKVVEIRKGTSTAVIVRSQDGSDQTIGLSPCTYVRASGESGSEHPLDCDFLKIQQAGERLIHVDKILDDGRGGFATCRVFPYYRRKIELAMAPGLDLRLECMEVTTRSQYEEVSSLDQFHYRSTNLWGKSQSLILVLSDPWRPDSSVAVGHITLNSPPLLSRPRDLIMGWDAEQRLAHIDRVVRIARVVVHPEYRGIGLGALLVKDAVEYSRHYWNAMGKKPWLIEVVAEMAKFHPVFDRAGLHRVGDTLGREAILYVPPESLDSTQSAGHWRSSLDRMKMKASNPKPYYALGLAGEIETRVRSLASTTEKDRRAKPTAPLAPPLLRLDDVHLQRRGEHALLDAIVGATSPFLDVRMSGPEAARSRLESIDDGLSGDDHVALLAELKERLADVVPNRVGSMQGPLGVAARDLGRLRAAIGRLRETADAMYLDLSGLAETVQIGLDQCRELVASIQSGLSEAVAGIDAEIAEVVDESRGASPQWRELSSLRQSMLSLSRSLGLLRWSQRVSDISTAFGLPPEVHADVDVVEALSLDIAPGSIVLLTGPSASGKTTLLDALAGRVEPSSGSIQPAGLSGLVETLNLQFPNGVPIIDLIGGDTGAACDLLNAAGISEARVYAKTKEQLSHGQHYRVAAALLADSGKPIWIADEFCAFLDPLTALIVSRGLSRMARRRGATLIVATADGHAVVPGLQPDFVVSLRSGRPADPQPRLTHWSSYADWTTRVAQYATPGEALQPWGARVTHTACGQVPLEPGIAHDLLWRNDIIYHRINTEWTVRGEAFAEEEALSAVSESLALQANQVWTTRTLSLQIRMRMRVFRDLRGQGARSV